MQKDLILDEILSKTIIKKVSDEEIASQTKNFHNKIFDEKHDSKIDKGVNNYVKIKRKDYQNLKVGMVIGFLKKNTTQTMLINGRIIDMVYGDSKLKYIEIYNLVLCKNQIINKKEYDIYIYDKYLKEDGELHNYIFVENLIILEHGQYIKYINKKNRGKVSSAGKITGIVYNEEKTKILQLELFDYMFNRFWKIYADKYYIYVFDKIEKEINIMNKQKNKLIDYINKQ